MGSNKRSGRGSDEQMKWEVISEVEWELMNKVGGEARNKIIKQTIKNKIEVNKNE